MRLFSTRAFLYTFAIALSLSFAIALAIVATQGMIAASSVLISVLASLGISAAIAALIAGYRLPLRWATWAYRAFMRRLAKRAIRSSLSYSMMPIECTGILEIDNEVALQIRAGTSDGIRDGHQFNVYESMNNELWGRVVAINVRPFDCDCITTDRVNIEFWRELERRMRYNTSKPPNVHLVRDLPVIFLMEQVERLLDDWR